MKQGIVCIVSHWMLQHVKKFYISWRDKNVLVLIIYVTAAFE